MYLSQKVAEINYCKVWYKYVCTPFSWFHWSQKLSRDPYAGYFQPLGFFPIYVYDGHTSDLGWLLGPNWPPENSGSTPNTLSQINRNSKKIIFGLFLPSQKGSTGRYNKTVRKIPTNEKNWKIFSRISIFASFGDNLACSIWKVSYFVISFWL